MICSSTGDVKPIRVKVGESISKFTMQIKDESTGLPVDMTGNECWMTVKNTAGQVVASWATANYTAFPDSILITYNHPLLTFSTWDCTLPVGSYVTELWVNFITSNLGKKFIGSGSIIVLP